MMKFIREFKAFAVKGNMLDIAVGVIIGAAFSKVIDVLVKEIFLPPLSLLTNGLNWESKKIILRKAISNNGIISTQEVSIGYGKLLEASVDFIIVSASIFIVIKFMNSLRKKADDVKDTSVPTPKDIELLSRVADLLEKQNDLLRGKTMSNGQNN